MKWINPLIKSMEIQTMESNEEHCSKHESRNETTKENPKLRLKTGCEKLES